MQTPAVSVRSSDPARAFIGEAHRLLIGGEWVAAVSGKEFPVFDPATGEVITQVAEADAGEDMVGPTCSMEEGCVTCSA